MAKPHSRPRRPPRRLVRPAGARAAADVGGGPGLWDAVVLWQLGPGLVLAALAPQGVA